MYKTWKFDPSDKSFTKIILSEIMSQLIELKDFKKVQDLKNIEALREQFRIMESVVAAVVEGKVIYSSELENFLEVNKWGYILCISLKSYHYYQVLVGLLKEWQLMDLYLPLIYKYIYIICSILGNFLSESDFGFYLHKPWYFFLK